MLYAPSRVAYLTMLLHVFYIVASALFAVRCSIPVLPPVLVLDLGRKKTSSRAQENQLEITRAIEDFQWAIAGS